MSWPVPAENQGTATDVENVLPHELTAGSASYNILAIDSGLGFGAITEGCQVQV